MTLETIAAIGVCIVIVCFTVLLSVKLYLSHVERVRQTEAEIKEDGKNHRSEIRDNREAERMRIEAQIWKQENSSEGEEDELTQYLPLIMSLFGKKGGFPEGQSNEAMQGLIKQAAQNPDLIKGLMENPTVKNALTNFSGGESGGVPAK